MSLSCNNEQKSMQQLRTAPRQDLNRLSASRDDVLDEINRAWRRILDEYEILTCHKNISNITKARCKTATQRIEIRNDVWNALRCLLGCTNNSTKCKSMDCKLRHEDIICLMCSGKRDPEIFCYEDQATGFRFNSKAYDAIKSYLGLEVTYKRPKTQPRKEDSKRNNRTRQKHCFARAGNERLSRDFEEKYGYINTLLILDNKSPYKYPNRNRKYVNSNMKVYERLESMRFSFFCKGGFFRLLKKYKDAHVPYQKQYDYVQGILNVAKKVTTKPVFSYEGDTSLSIPEKDDDPDFDEF